MRRSLGDANTLRPLMGIGFPWSPQAYLDDRALRYVVQWLGEQYGPRIEVIVDDQNPRFNAFASIENGTRKVQLALGLVFNPKVTSDILALVGCHEVGHHEAGPPHFEDTEISVEGQADYWATQTCFQKFVEQHPHLRPSISAGVEKYCATVPIDRSKLEHCFRTMEASLRLAEIFREIKTKKVFAPPSLDVEDTLQVPFTIRSHGSPQCRLDSMRRGFFEYFRAPSERPLCWFNPNDPNNGAFMTHMLHMMNPTNSMNMMDEVHSL